MRATIGKLGIAGAVAVLVAACGGPEKPELMHLRKTTQGPDEFAIVPTKPLTMPENLSLLPAPTPGGRNITDPTPEADAVTALGGRPGAGVAADGAFIAQIGRFGTDPAIRQSLATEDLQWRRDHDSRLLERMFSISTYFKAYAPMALDQIAESERWRARGLRTPASPPSSEAQNAMP
ncbi:DUF3035 domain-containing protein [Paenirhodobacter sp.]|uniref:DUF3035 domain-containing protein n=1 Tax=Paenirhodobacter sp. TaxID=1965326 RepID=UPI003B3F97F1